MVGENSEWQLAWCLTSTYGVQYCRRWPYMSAFNKTRITDGHSLEIQIGPLEPSLMRCTCVIEFKHANWTNAECFELYASFECCHHSSYFHSIPPVSKNLTVFWTSSWKASNWSFQFSDLVFIWRGMYKYTKEPNCGDIPPCIPPCIHLFVA